MGVRTDCRHYLERSTSPHERVQRCRIDVAELDPFACPPSCLFFEARTITDAGWTRQHGRGDDD